MNNKQCLLECVVNNGDILNRVIKKEDILSRYSSFRYSLTNLLVQHFAFVTITWI